MLSPKGNWLFRSTYTLYICIICIICVRVLRAKPYYVQTTINTTTSSFQIQITYVPRMYVWSLRVQSTAKNIRLEIGHSSIPRDVFAGVTPRFTAGLTITPWSRDKINAISRSLTNASRTDSNTIPLPRPFPRHAKKSEKYQGENMEKQNQENIEIFNSAKKCIGIYVLHTHIYTNTEYHIEKMGI